MIALYWILKTQNQITWSCQSWTTMAFGNSQTHSNLQHQLGLGGRISELGYNSKSLSIWCYPRQPTYNLNDHIWIWNYQALLKTNSIWPELLGQWLISYSQVDSGDLLEPYWCPSDSQFSASFSELYQATSIPHRPPHICSIPACVLVFFACLSSQQPWKLWRPL
jgi:hypothetical protein